MPPEALLSRTLDPVHDARWAAFAARVPEATVFHQPAWLALLRDQYGYAMEASCVLAGDRVVAGLPLARVSSAVTGERLVGLPFTDACAPLLDAGTAGARSALAAALDARRRAAGLDLEVRAPFAELPAGRPVPGFLQHAIALEADTGAVLRRARPQLRRGAQKARRAGLEVRRDAGPGGLDAFYRLHLRTRRRQGVPIQPRRFIARFAALFARGMGHTLLVHDGPRPVAAAVFLVHAGTMTYKYGASDERRLDVRPNNLLFAEAMSWGCEQGLRVLDLGRTSAGNAGLAAFKRGLGAEEQALAYTTTAAPGRSLADGAAGRLLAGALRHGPLALTRITGELLYRHVG